MPSSAQDIHRYIAGLYTRGYATGDDGKRHDLSLSLAPARADLVFRACRGCHAKTTLEAGFAFGASTLAIIAALLENGVSGPAAHVAMDPFQEKWFGNAGLRTLRDAGVESMVAFTAEPSEIAMARMLAAGRGFDFILIDGDHTFDHTFVDIFYAHRMLAPGGVMVVDDVEMPPVFLATRFLTEYYHYEVIDEVFGAHQDPDQKWNGAPLTIAPHLLAKARSGIRPWTRAYRKPSAAPAEEPFWGAPYRDFMRFWLDPAGDPKLMLELERRALNSEALRALEAGDNAAARRYLFAALSRDPRYGKSWTRLARTLLPRALTRMLGGRR